MAQHEPISVAQVGAIWVAQDGAFYPNVLQKHLEEKKKELPSDCRRLEYSFKKVIKRIKDKNLKIPMRALNREIALQMLLQNEKQKNEDIEIEFALIQEYLSSID